MISIDFTSDVICPWCFIGLKRLEKAIESFPTTEFSFTFHPFLLDPSLPKTGVDKKQLLAGKFGGMERVAAMHSRIKAIGEECGINFNENGIVADTFASHSLLSKAKADGIQYKLKKELLHVYHEGGKSLGDYEVLIDAYTRSGGDRECAVEFLNSHGTKHRETLVEIEEAKMRGIHGVPFVVLRNTSTQVEIAISGGQPTLEFIAAIKQIL